MVVKAVSSLAKSRNFTDSVSPILEHVMIKNKAGEYTINQ
ncbi:hypothetical protein AB434_2364 [Heyndrickxia coagulans]|jgi:hypothetical protein|uniref:Uncharacterized protein n=1 Tax=Heyndrickxia coagulans TaxID=1398 RepID=A0A0C5C5X9_HEYCO|nr:hypothetical protein SB48_HM08orf04690 [Heyndrickxia coagulans]AKN54769.1 hypothetical protein AB434_2364 [Heyndrickxia coagulans]KWZ77856.1 hypothetical protein HMPREF3213_03161 [Heyndrickxia coagulans]